jgi:hypothetical protein
VGGFRRAGKINYGTRTQIKVKNLNKFDEEQTEKW